MEFFIIMGLVVLKKFRYFMLVNCCKFFVSVGLVRGFVVSIVIFFLGIFVIFFCCNFIRGWLVICFVKDWLKIFWFIVKVFLVGIVW